MFSDSHFDFDFNKLIADEIKSYHPVPFDSWTTKGALGSISVGQSIYSLLHCKFPISCCQRRLVLPVFCPTISHFNKPDT